MVDGNVIPIHYSNSVLVSHRRRKGVRYMIVGFKYTNSNLSKHRIVLSWLNRMKVQNDVVYTLILPTLMNPCYQTTCRAAFNNENDIRHNEQNKYSYDAK